MRIKKNIIVSLCCLWSLNPTNSWAASGQPWVSSPEKIARGKTIFTTMCVACHGMEGKGDGPAAVALKPAPRNFSVVQGWKNGRKPTQVWKTLKEGIPGSAMVPFLTIPSEDRWALVHFVLSLGGKPDADTADDLAKLSAEIEKKEVASAQAPQSPASPTSGDMGTPIAQVMEKLAEPDFPEKSYQAEQSSDRVIGAGEGLYREYCLRCHGAQGEGGVRIRNIGVNPVAFITTHSWPQQAGGTEEEFDKIVAQGIPGELMPGNGQLTRAEIKLIYDYLINK